MVVKEGRGFAVMTVNILDINCIEMTQMHELKNRIKDVLDSHKSEEKKKYISDEDLKLMHAILSVFTKKYEIGLTSEFDNFLKEEAEKEHAADIQELVKAKAEIDDVDCEVATPSTASFDEL